MSKKRITTWEARIEIISARCALETLTARRGNSGATKPPGPFIQPFEDDIADIAQALTTLGNYVAQQDTPPSGWSR